MDSNTVRQKYFDFFQARGHALIPSASLVPQNDPTTLFTGSGMQPLVPYLLGEKHPKGTRLVDSQKSFRAEDIEEVGDNRHTTFFEMLGNWSLGDYFKKEQLPWFFEFLTKEIGLDPYKLYVTVFDGDNSLSIPRDEESIEIWRNLFTGADVTAEFAEIGSEENGYARGMKDGERIFSYGEKNWWSRSGAPQNMPEGEPGGPDSEVFYDFGPNPASPGGHSTSQADMQFGTHCHPNCDCGRFLEIGNSVFMEYIKTANGFEKLPQQNVDFGGGLERITAASNENPDVFKIDTLGGIIKNIEKATGVSYEQNKRAFRIIADHMRAAVFMIADGVLPSNTEQGYFVRRLLRRSAVFINQLNTKTMLEPLIYGTIDNYKIQYPQLAERREEIAIHVAKEESKFIATLSRGLKQFEILARASTISGHDAFILFSTYGFPFEVTLELANERRVKVDVQAFKKEMEKHQETSRAGAEKRFKGGLADAGDETTRLHTTHHLLLKALQMVLGGHVKQKGSNITGERLRIDFSHQEKMTEEEKHEVERIVNEKMSEGLPVIASSIPKEEAEKLGAQQEFGQKYPDIVTVYSVGPKDATPENPKHSESFSIEFCGGPHVSNTSEIGKSGAFKIKSEKSAAAGIRRIRGVLE
ncbi:alanine--tRNA ligase [Candidatus Kaiserbacteria bacterium CG10_big_fil_rev_8_21_14_0_10_43_70]|uniref:alanine--tRNA ligase n=1 Tax=Candidatus Kaiserbacteria bacterium CG10_big_fil_rev_8_21_14_0_10_43_70 TaxID=1974605 RepID=A0A2H0UIM3_9BACT|nr:MAG: alanine--tRNA ligase [Candidatus Kaiserbacteria bacterium CG10_big_fil_rev_8_21_14_0_10_43_70]